jgi:hypothetical protein
MPASSLGRRDRLPLRLLLAAQGLMAAGDLLQLAPHRLAGQHLLLLASLVQALAQLLVSAGLGAVLFQLLAACQQFLLDDAAALLPLVHLIELAAGLLDATVEQGHTGQFIDDAAPFTGTHRDDAGDVALHDHVAAVGVDAQPAQLGLELLQVAGHAIGAVAAAVGAARGDAQPAGDAPLRLAGPDPGALLRSLQPRLRLIGLPVAQIKVHRDGGLGGLAFA